MGNISLSFLGKTDEGRQQFQWVYFRNRKQLPNDRLVGGGCISLVLLADHPLLNCSVICCLLRRQQNVDEQLVAELCFMHRMWEKILAQCYNCLIG